MIHEFAVDPDLVIGWCKDKYAYRHFITQFGLGTPRIVSGFPKKKKIRRIFRDVQSGLGEIERVRLMELFTALTETLVTRDYEEYDGAIPWSQNAIIENAKLPFHAILTQSNPRRHDFVLKESEAMIGDCKWDLPLGKIVNRTASEMAKNVSCLLQNSRKIILIDPYFLEYKTLKRWLNTLENFCTKIPKANYCSDKFHMEYICSADLYDRTDFKVFKKRCEDELPSILPKDLKLTVKRYSQGRSGQKLHNRYILTDIGGVLFQHGFDGCEIDDGQTDDLNLLEKGQYIKRWEEYVNNPIFDIDGSSIHIVGEKS